MRISRQKMVITAILAIYWVTIFTATHIPVPSWTRKMGISDKTMHLAAYMVLTFLLLFHINFKQRINWKKLRPYLTAAIVLLYGAADELLQLLISGRSFDLHDLSANMLGAAVSLATVTFLPPVHAVMIPVTTCAFFIPAVVKCGLLKENSLAEVGGYLAGFAFITAAWFVYFAAVVRIDFKKFRFLPLLLAPPAVTILAVKTYAVLTNKPFGNTAIYSACLAVIVTAFLSLPFAKLFCEVDHIQRVADKDYLP